MRVRDLPERLRIACHKSGMISDAEVTPRQACKLWAGGSYSHQVMVGNLLDLYDHATALQRKENQKR